MQYTELNLDKTEFISSTKNQIVKSFVALRRPRRRRQASLTLVEGFKILRLAIDAGFYPQTVLYTPETTNDSDRGLLHLARENGARIISATDQVMERVSQREGPLGCVASVPMQYTPLESLESSKNSLLLVVEALEKPGNIGALIRTASAAGARGVIVVDSQTDALAPACIHASLGAVFGIPLVNTTTAQALNWLQQHEIQIIATSPDAKKYYFEVNLREPICVAVGNEHRGLSDAWLKAGTPVQIPMSGPMNSLNATSAGAIVLFEAVRQRFDSRKN